MAPSFMRPGRSPADAGGRFPEKALLWAIRAGIALILLTPLVVDPSVDYPFAVSKAVYARSLIAVVFVLWTLLALVRPEWRPRPGAILALLGASLAVGFAAAWFGVSPMRSLWSTYSRMDGLVNAAHWYALAVVLASILRTTGDWIRLFNVHLAVGLCVAAVAVLRLHVPEAAAGLLGPEPRYPRIRGTTGNPLFLGAYLQGVALLAAGFLVRSWAAPTAAGKTRAKRGAARTPPRLFWLATAGMAGLGIGATGSLGSLAGLAAGAATAAMLLAWLGGSPRERRGGWVALGVLAAAGLILALTLAIRAGDPPGRAFNSVLVERVTSIERIGATLGTRLRSWRSALNAIAERPWLGWGPENYLVASARHLPPSERPAVIHDRAHNAMIEQAATRGLAGLAVYLALWGAVALTIVRAARGANARDRMLIVFAGAALAGWFVQSQVQFHSPPSLLQHMLLLGFAAWLEGARRGRNTRTTLRTVRAPFRYRAAAAGIFLGAVLLAAGSLASGRAIHAGAAAIHRAEFEGPFPAEIKRAMRAFGPLANGPRIIMFNNVAANWPVLVAKDSREAARMLEWMDAEATAALVAEPHSWVLHHALARLYRNVADTHPDYANRTRHHFRRSLELAPNLDPLQPPAADGAGR